MRLSLAVLWLDLLFADAAPFASARTPEHLAELLPSQRMFFEEMLVAAQPAFVRWGIRAITEWLGAGELPMPVYHIHGSDDELIPCENVHADHVIPGGGHLINVTHAAELAGVSRRFLQRMGARLGLKSDDDGDDDDD